MPVEGKTVSFPANTILTAIGELVEYDLLTDNGIAVDDRGNILVDEFNETSVDNVFIAGDAYRGPATVVEGIADARKTADGILRRERVEERLLTLPAIEFEADTRREEVEARKAVLVPQLDAAVFEEEYRAETERCLECNFLCNKCVSVCPNRANIAIKVGNGLEKENQILHLDALCNECGNCETFCPYQGAPYKDKFTLFWDQEAFLENENEGYLQVGDHDLKLRYQGQILDLSYSNGKVVPADPELAVDGELQGLFEIMLAVRDQYDYLLPS